MRLENFTTLVFKQLKQGSKTPSEIAKSLGISRANITIWLSSGEIPDRHFQRLVKELNIPKQKAIDALQKDLKEIFK